MIVPIPVKVDESLAKLIDTVGKAVGTVCLPWMTVRQANANAEAKIINARADAEVLEINGRARHRIEYIERIRQENLEQAVKLSELELPSEVSQEPVDQTWMLNWVTKAQDVSDDDLRKIWAKILAGEVTSPGSYSKRTLDFLSTFEKYEAQMFTAMCSLAIHWETGGIALLHSPTTDFELSRMFEDRDYLAHFTSIGLLSTDERIIGVSETSGRRFKYFDKSYEMVGPKKSSSGALDLLVGFASFSLIGMELAQIAGSTEIPDYLERVSADWEKEFKISLSKRE